MDSVSPHDEHQRVLGALDILSILKEEFAQWADEAQDASKREALDNVLAHVERIESDYRIRSEKAG